jgi:hypothetical protein
MVDLFSAHKICYLHLPTPGLLSMLFLSSAVCVCDSIDVPNMLYYSTNPFFSKLKQHSVCNIFL